MNEIEGKQVWREARKLYFLTKVQQYRKGRISRGTRQREREWGWGRGTNKFMGKVKSVASSTLQRVALGAFIFHFSFFGFRTTGFSSSCDRACPEALYFPSLSLSLFFFLSFVKVNWVTRCHVTPPSSLFVASRLINRVFPPHSC